MNTQQLTSDGHEGDIDYSQNWSKNIQFHAQKVLFPASVDEVIDIVKNPRYVSVKAFGSRHCFNSIADTAVPVAPAKIPTEKTTHVHLGMEKMTGIKIYPPTSSGIPTVQFEAGVTFTQLMQAVSSAGFALSNMPSLPHISVVGGILTGTHGSGIRNGIIAKSVLEMKIVHANGMLGTYRRNSPDGFDNFWIHLGALGVVVSVTMELEADYQIAKGIYLDLPYREFLDKIDEIMGVDQDAEFVSVFMDWKAPRMNSVWVGKKYHEEGGRPLIPQTFFGAKHIDGSQFHPVPGQDPAHCVETGYGSWTTKLNHFLPDHPPSSAGNEIQAEYFVPYSKFRFALEALWAIRESFAELVQITELRAMAQDNLPLSQAKNEAAAAFHFTLLKVSPDVLDDVLGRVEAALDPFSYKMHWGKWFVCRGSRIEQMHGHDLNKLRHLIERHDPDRRFANEYLRSCLIDGAPPPTK